jgi:hypothetical protein
MPMGPVPECAAAARAMPGVALHSGHHRTHDREIDLVVAPCSTGRPLSAWPGSAHRRVLSWSPFRRERGPVAGHPLCDPGCLCARSGTPGFLRLVRLLTLRWRQAGIVRGFRRFVKLCFEYRNPCRQVLHLHPQRPDQGVFLGAAQVVKVRKLEPAPVRADSIVTVSPDF